MGLGIVDSKSRTSWLPLWHRNRKKPTTISVMGVYRGAGATFQSIAIANYLSSKGYRIGLLEMQAAGDFAAIQAAYEGLGFAEENEHFTIKRVTYFPLRENRKDEAIMAMPFDYIIHDMGAAASLNTHAVSSDFMVIVSQGAIWRQRAVEDLIQNFGDSITRRWTLVVSFAEKNDIKRLKRTWTGDVYLAPYVEDPFVIDGKTRSIYDGMLGV